MLTQMYLAAINLLASGSITGKDSALLNPGAKYTHEQIVGGLIFDIVVSVILLLWLFYVSYKTYGPPNRWFRRRTQAAS